MNIHTSSPRAAALSLALGIAGLLTLVPANEGRAVEVRYNTNGTGACRATSSAGSNAFYYNHTYIWNGSAGTQYLTCVFPNQRVENSTASVGTIMFWSSGATAGTVTCTAQMSSYFYGANYITAGNTQPLSLSANAFDSILFPPLSRADQSIQTVNIICSVPPGFKLGALQNIETD